MGKETVAAGTEQEPLESLESEEEMLGLKIGAESMQLVVAVHAAVAFEAVLVTVVGDVNVG